TRRSPSSGRSIGGARASGTGPSKPSGPASGCSPAAPGPTRAAGRRWRASLFRTAGWGTSANGGSTRNSLTGAGRSMRDTLQRVAFIGGLTLATLTATGAQATSVTLDFDGLDTSRSGGLQILDFYAGGNS